jgi:hypothetical protein
VLTELTPIAVAVAVVCLLHRYAGMRVWHAVACIIAGLVLAGSVAGPQLTQLISDLTGGFL